MIDPQSSSVLLHLLTHPVVAAILLSLGVIGLLTELKAGAHGLGLLIGGLALGVFFGAVLKGALQASLFAQGAALFLVFGTLGLHLAFAILGGNDTFRPLLWLNPFLALLWAGYSRWRHASSGCRVKSSLHAFSVPSNPPDRDRRPVLLARIGGRQVFQR